MQTLLAEDLIERLDEERGLADEAPDAFDDDEFLAGVEEPTSVEVGSNLSLLVGTAGLEPATSASRTLRATKLRHVPIMRIRHFASSRTGR